MADVVVTPASIAPASNAIKSTGIAGEAFATAGLSCYQKSGDKRWYKSDKDAAQADAIAWGIALNAAPAAGMPLVVQEGGDLNPGFTVVVNTAYIAGEAAGGIAAIADLGSGEYLHFLGFGVTTSLLRLRPFASGAATA